MARSLSHLDTSRRRSRARIPVHSLPGVLLLAGIVGSGLSTATILGVRPKLTVDIREDILREEDGPMLKHGLQGFQGVRILIPGAHHLRPDRDYLAERYEIFKKAG